MNTIPCYYFPVNIRPDKNNWRIHFLKLETSHNPVTASLRNYIIELPEGDIKNYSLFDISQSAGKQLLSNESKKKNVDVTNLQFDIEENIDVAAQKVHLAVTITKNNGGGSEIASTPLIYFRQQKVGSNLRLSLSGANLNDMKVIVTFCYRDTNDTSAQQYKDSFSLYITRAARVLYGSLDFGSEASQMAWVRAGKAANAHKTVPIIHYLEKLTSFKLQQNEVIVQKEGTKNLIKSIYYIKAQLAHPYHNYKHIPLVDSSKDIIMISGDKTDYGADHLLPNLKLYNKDAEGEGIELNENFIFTTATGNIILLSDIHDNVTRQLINNYITVLLEELVSLSQEQSGNISLNLRMLAPNIYTEEKVKKLVENIYKDFEDIKTDVNSRAMITPNVPRTSIAAIEVCTVSESDSSIIHEIIRNKDEYRDKDILTIDCGKGTTDIGMCHVDNNGHMLSLYRAGFAGAGNYLTHGYFEYFINLFKKIEAKDIIAIDSRLKWLYEWCSNKLQNAFGGTIPTPLPQYNKIPDNLTAATFGLVATSKQILQQNAQQLSELIDMHYAGVKEYLTHEIEELQEIIWRLTSNSTSNLTEFKKRLYALKRARKEQLADIFNTLKEHSVSITGEADEPKPERSYNINVYNKLLTTVIGNDADGFITELQNFITSKGNKERCIRHFYNANENDTFLIKLPDEIEQKIDGISKAIVDKITQSGYFHKYMPDKIFLTGRSFLHGPLLDAIRSQLVNMMGDLQKNPSINADNQRRLAKLISALKNKFMGLFSEETDNKEKNIRYAEKVIVFKPEFSFLKQNCVVGAIYQDADINHGADLVGVLVIRQKNEANVRSQFDINLITSPISPGGDNKNANSITLTLNESIYGYIKNAKREDKIYYVGEGFLFQPNIKNTEDAGKCEFLERGSSVKPADNTGLDYSQMLNELFFPFFNTKE